MNRLGLGLRAGSTIGIAALLLAAAPVADEKAYREEIAKWRESMEESLRRPEGWLAVDGLFWLTEGENSVGSEPGSDVVLPAEAAPPHVGTLELKGGKVFFYPLGDVQFSINGKPGAGQELKPDDPGPADKVRTGEAVFKVLKRGARYGVRLYNPNCKNRLEFKGRHWFPVDPALRIEATFVPYDPPKTLQILNVLGDTSPSACPGYAEFTIGGKSYRMEAEGEGDVLFFNFKDKTSGKTTYPASRFLYADKPVNGKVVIDFNKAYSPPCAFTAFATCPLPPKENHLSVEIRAGEKYVHRD